MYKTPFTLNIRCEFSCGFVFPKKVLYDLNVSCWKKRCSKDLLLEKLEALTVPPERTQMEAVILRSVDG